MVVKLLWLTGATIFLILGTIHLLYTFFTNKFDARNRDVIQKMKDTSPLLTRDTTMWKAWIGFNASHSAGAIFFGLINSILVLQYFSVIQYSLLLHLLNIITAIFYLWLGKKYWFKIPFTGILVSTICFITATIISFFG